MKSKNENHVRGSEDNNNDGKMVNKVIDERKSDKEDEQHKGEEPVKTEIRTVTIRLEHYENILPFYPTADAQARVKYLDKVLGDTTLIPITDDPILHIDESFDFKVNITSPKELDSLISSPALLTVSQFSGSCDPMLYEQLQRCEELKNVSSSKSFDSIVSIYEAFTGDRVDRDIINEAQQQKVKGKPKKGEKKKEKPKPKEKATKPTKQSKSGKGAKKKGRKSETPSDEPMDLNLGPIIYGMCVIDFLPLFYGKERYTEALTINPLEKYVDERMTTYKKRPKLTVTVSVDRAICFPDPVILNVTVESIYNLPTMKPSDMDCKLCTRLSMENSAQEPMLFTNPTYTTKTQENVMKCWPGIKRIGADANTTRYKISEDNIKNITEEEIENIAKGTSPRMQFNVLKRNLLLKDGMDALCFQLQTYRKILIEILIAGKEKPRLSIKPSDSSVEEKRERIKSDTSIKSIKEKSRISDFIPRKKSQQNTHFMAFIDISTLLYPGVTKVRVACPVKTFNFSEALLMAGAVDSYFLPKQKKDTQEMAPEPLKSQEKVDKLKKERVSKSSDKIARKNSLHRRLTSRSGTLTDFENSTYVFGENGKPSFVVVEIELSKPIYEKRDIKDLNHDLQEILQEKMQNTSKIVLTHSLTKNYYREVLNRIAKDIYDKYKYFIKERSIAAEKDFIQYLESMGAYQTYLTSIKEAISLVTATKFKYEETDKYSSTLFQNFIGEMFVYLVSEMNDTLNRLICTGLEPVLALKPKPCDTLLFYAKEATALGRITLADRYYLERICCDEVEDPNIWFDYAIFNMELKLHDRAYECALEALSKKANHRYSLLLVGALLCNKGQKDEAETCFLNLLIHEPRWIEGWVTLYLFYEKYNKYDGMDMAMDMIKKYSDDERTAVDYFNEMEDLLWSPKICPKTIFFRGAVLLLKMRLYDWVESALALELQEHFGITHYLLAAICLHQRLYKPALEHIEQTKASYGFHYTISTLSGHCHFALHNYEEAKEDYYHVIECKDRPEDIHMVYINCSQILEELGNHQEARKLVLLACKYTPTHYSWYKAGQLYFKQQDLLSAEECFSEANFRDNRCPEYWAYLTIINLQLNRHNEAELCYSQAIKNNLDAAMHERIKKEFKKVSSVDTQT